jgi:prepilin-type N-terminal cleavage/methylation domain-containing protein
MTKMKIRRLGRGFSLLELIAVLAIMAVLVALGISFATPLISKATGRSTENVLELVVAAQREYAFTNGNWASTAAELSIGRGAEVISGTLVVASMSGNTCIVRRFGDPLAGSEPQEVSVDAGSPCTASLYLAGA